MYMYTFVLVQPILRRVNVVSALFLRIDICMCAYGCVFGDDEDKYSYMLYEDLYIFLSYLHV